MVLTRRERYIAIVTVAAIALLVFDQYVLSPVLDRLGEIQTQKRSLEEKRARGDSLLKQKKTADAWWKEKLAGGLKPDAAATERALDNAVHAWAQSANLNVVSYRPTRSSQMSHSPEVGVYLVASGGMRAVTDFLINAKKSALPVKVMDMEVRSSPEGSDELTLTLHLSGLYLPSDWKVASAASGGTHK